MANGACAAMANLGATIGATVRSFRNFCDALGVKLVFLIAYPCAVKTRFRFLMSMFMLIHDNRRQMKINFVGSK